MVDEYGESDSEAIIPIMSDVILSVRDLITSHMPYGMLCNLWVLG